MYSSSDLSEIPHPQVFIVRSYKYIPVFVFITYDTSYVRVYSLQPCARGAFLAFQRLPLRLFSMLATSYMPYIRRLQLDVGLSTLTLSLFNDSLFPGCVYIRVQQLGGYVHTSYIPGTYYTYIQYQVMSWKLYPVPCTYPLY